MPGSGKRADSAPYHGASMPTTLLLADDNKNIREFCRQELEDEGYHVLTGRDGREAVALFREQPADLVILDIAMPLCDGFQALEQIRSIDPDVPVVFFTSYDDECVNDPRARLAAACVEKSGDLGELKRVVAKILQCPRQSRHYHPGLPPAADERAQPEAVRTP